MNYLNKTPSQPPPSQGEEQNSLPASPFTGGRAKPPPSLSLHRGRSKTPSPDKGRDGVGL